MVLSRASVGEAVACRAELENPSAERQQRIYVERKSDTRRIVGLSCANQHPITSIVATTLIYGAIIPSTSIRANALLPRFGTEVACVLQRQKKGGEPL